MSVLANFDDMRDRLRAAVDAGLPPGPARAQALTAYAYYACTAIQSRGVDRAEALAEYTDAARNQAAAEAESWAQEDSLLRQQLHTVHGRLLDVGAGWGRLAPCYRELGVAAVFVEPSSLGVALMRRAGLDQVVQACGEALPLADDSFAWATVAWVLHHDGGTADASAILAETARVLRPDGRILSVEPVDQRFSLDTWRALLHDAGFAVDEVSPFFEMPQHGAEAKAHVLIAATHDGSTVKGMLSAKTG